jgi:hypothetical protein
MTRFRFAPSLFNEIVSHLLKHSFLDVVINFNFEETLDQAVEEEIGINNYHSVLSDGHCVDLNKVLVDGRLKTPIYIKPHGSYSHKSTLRFTNRHYFDLPTDIKIMLQQILSGMCGDPVKKHPIEKVNLIFVGFAMESLEFNKIVNQLPAKSVIYHLDFHPFSEEKLNNLFEIKFPDFYRNAASIGRTIIETKKTYSNIYKSISLSKFCQNDNKKEYEPSPKKNHLTSSLSELISIIWRITHNGFAQAYRPRSIARHEINCYLLYEPHTGVEPPNQTIDGWVQKREYLHDEFEVNSEYFLDRVLVEITLAVNRNNGIVDILELLRGRVGRYYKLYRDYIHLLKEPANQPLSLYDLLHEFTRHRDDFTNKNGTQTFKTDAQANFKNSKNIFILRDIINQADLLDEKKFIACIRHEIQQVELNFKNVRLRQGIDDTIFQDLNRQQALLLETLYEKFTERYADYLNPQPGKIPVTTKQVTRTITLLCRLLSSTKLSNRFKINLLKNFSHSVYNGKKENKMLDEVYRLLEKTVGNHYFIINSSPQDPTHFMFESFKQKNLIHTNLALSYKFNDIFENNHWDVLLIISETGSNLDFLKYMDPAKKVIKRKEFKDKHLIIVCSYEAVAQLHQEKDTKSLAQKHKTLLCAGILNEENVTLTFVPFREHNHHMTIFLQTIINENEFLKPTNSSTKKMYIDPSDSKKNWGFVLAYSIYMFRQGLSNSMDPLFIGANPDEISTDFDSQDQDKLLSLFFTHVLRSNVYTNTSVNDNSWLRHDCMKWDSKSTNLSKSAKQNINNIKLYKTWTTTEFDSHVNIFLKRLYNQIVNKK